MDLRQISVLQGDTFVVSDGQGDIDASPRVPAGPFAWDTRHLSKRQLRIDGIKPRPLPVDDLQYSQTKFFLAPEAGTGRRGRVDAFGWAGSRCAWRTSCCGGWSRADEAFGMECR